MEEEKKRGITVNQETIDILVANIIPTTKYFESRFDFMQHQIDEIKKSQEELKRDIDKRFEQVDKRFEQVDKRFEQVDKRFEQVDKRFEQVDERFKEMNDSIKKLTDEVHTLAVEIKESNRQRDIETRDFIIDRDRYYDKKFNNLRMFNIALISLIGGIILKITGILDKVLK